MKFNEILHMHLCSKKKQLVYDASVFRQRMFILYTLHLNVKVLQEKIKMQF
jgi:hypothetical protein